MISKLKELEEWYESHDYVESAKCIIKTSPLGSVVSTPSGDISKQTGIQSTIIFADGEKWQDYCTRIGEKEVLMEDDALSICIQTCKISFDHHLTQ